MRDSIDHREAPMKRPMNRREATTQATKRRQQAGIPDPELAELLAHLGRLIAREYVALLRQNRKEGET